MCLCVGRALGFIIPRVLRFRLVTGVFEKLRVRVRREERERDRGDVRDILFSWLFVFTRREEANCEFTALTSYKNGLLRHSVWIIIFQTI